MDKSEFDQFAEEYKNILKNNIRCTGDDPEFFAEYKIKDTFQYTKKLNFENELEILDFGSGIGNPIGHLKKYFPSSNLISLDVSEKSLTIAQERFGNQAKYVLFDGFRIPLKDNSFDIIFTACVFHHIPPQEHQHTLSELKKILKPNDRLLFLSSPLLIIHSLYMLSILAFLMKMQVLIRTKDFKTNLLSCHFHVKKLYIEFFPSHIEKITLYGKISCLVSFRCTVLYRCT